MTIKVSQKTKADELERALKSLKRNKNKINVDKYFGKVNFGTDGLTYQKKVRNEWK